MSREESTVLEISEKRGRVFLREGEIFRRGN